MRPSGTTIRISKMIVSIQHCLWLLLFFATCVVSFQSPTKPRVRSLVATTPLFALGRGENKTTDEINGAVVVAPFAFDYPENEGMRQKSYSTAATWTMDVLDAINIPGSMAVVPEEEGDDGSSPSLSWNLADIQSVLTTALLVTGNTVGAGALVLPELAAKPGFAISTAMFSVAYLINLMSGLILAEVAIKQHEAEQRQQTALMGNICLRRRRLFESLPTYPWNPQ